MSAVSVSQQSLNWIQFKFTCYFHDAVWLYLLFVLDGLKIMGEVHSVIVQAMMKTSSLIWTYEFYHVVCGV